MHKKMLGLSSLLMAGMLTVSSVGTGALHVYAAEEPAVTDSADEEQTDEAQDDAKDGDVAKDPEEVKSEEEVKPEETKAEDEEKPAEEAADETPEVAETKEEVAPEEDKAEEDKDDAVKEKTEGEDAPEAGDEVEPKKEYEVSENAPTLYHRWKKNEVKGRIEFSGQYDEYIYDLGEDISAEQLKKITIKIKDQEGKIAVKLHNADTINVGNSQVKVDYFNDPQDEIVFTNDFDGSVRYIGIMSLEDKEYGVTVDDIKVEKDDKSDEPGEYEKFLTFEGEDLKFIEQWDGEEVEGSELVFDQEWREYRLDLGETIPGEDVKSVTFTFAEPTKNLAIKTYGGLTDEGKHKELKADYGKSGKTSYTSYPGVTGDVDAVAVMAMSEQEFPFTCKVEKVQVVVDVTPEELRPKSGVEYDIVDLRDPVTALLGDDFIIGTAASYDEFADDMEMELAYKHFNGVTLGNELKPDSMLKKNAKIITVEIGGEEIQVPELDFTTPENRLDRFVEWNEKNPDKQIKIRGHVLVWHSQTPEFFFHEDYDTSKPYVTPDVMNKRLEYYIKSVAEHFTAEGSKYAGMFYGWDVVNEAVSDSRGTYRNGDENSSWWRVYESPEFIQNAFVYANKYMDPSIALFYNDYNETVSSKVDGICELLTTVKNTPGARIDGMGMQAHYQIDAGQPSIAQIKDAAKRYAKIVDQIQITELDFKGASSAKDARLAQRYKDVYDTIRRLRNEGVNFTGMTIWGITDKHSWLQTANNNGGGSNGNSKQYPLLFDDYYKAKECFYAIAEAGELEPEVKNITLVQKLSDDFTAGESYEFGEGETKATFVPMWKDGELDVKVTVTDATDDANDSFTVFTDDGAGIKSTTVKRSEAAATETGYEKVLVIDVDADALMANAVKMDVTVTDGNKTFAFGDTTLKQAESSKYFATTVVKPLLPVGKGTVEIDGDASDDAWKDATKVQLSINTGSPSAASAKILWDEENLYVLAEVKDADLNKDNSNAWEQDSVEFFIDENNAKTNSYEADDKQYRVNFENTQSFNGTKCKEENIKSAAKVTEDGYFIEAAFKWTDITAVTGTKVGFDVQLNDADKSGKRVGTINWADNSGQGYASTAGLGTLLLTDDTANVEPANDEPAPTVEAKVEVEVPEGKVLTYNGKEQVGVVDGEGFTLTGNKAVNAGTYKATATLKDGFTWKGGNTDKKTITWTIKKAENTASVTGNTVKIKKSKVSRKSVKYALSKFVKVEQAEGDVTYEKVSGNKKIKINNKTGKVTVKKGIKKGTYKVKVKVTVAGNDNFEATEETVTFKVKIKK
ncbi:endo-1,4-beta-xylanase [Butyrivibrio sp. XPD2002]|uniref:endo-1,4-beta-xylanase n=1 Tax=Butyrivibrio sp. XPD2002 TaxID=1280665 RepID=UPI00041809AE|nr:endo-1,4-beta-xylanase [Butyrivibrio sp. XPD2002]